MAVHVLTTAPEAAPWTRSERGEMVRAIVEPPAYQRTVATPVDHANPGALRSLKRMAGRSFPGLKRQYTAWRQFPDHWRELTPALINAALDADCHLVYSTAPPISMHLAAEQISDQLGVPWVAEFRDPWNDPATGRDAFAGTVMARTARKLLEHIVTKPSRCVGVSAGTVAWLTRHQAHAPLLCRNGIPDRLLDSAAGRPPVIPGRISYFGDFYLNRSPIPLFDAIASLRNNGQLGFDGVEIELVGDVAMFNDDSTVQMLADRGLAASATFSHRIPHEEVIGRMRKAGLLLLLAQQQPRQVPNKLYEYLAANRPILAWVDAEGESARLLRQVGGHFLVTEQTPATEIPAIVSAAMDAAVGNWAPEHPEVLHGLRTSVQLESVVASVQRLAALGMP